MLNVLYDASVLGIAYRNQSTFGLSRTADQLLAALLEQPEVSLSLSSDVSYNVWLFTRLYLAQHPTYGRLPWRSDALNARFRNLIKDWLLKDALFSRYLAQLKKIGLVKNEARAYQWRSELMEWRFRGTPRRSLAGLDIYHSNYHALPAVIREQHKVKAVLTVHDLIPILHPEWCGMLGQGAQQYFHPEFNLPATLRGLNRDHWIICPSAASRDDVCEYLGTQIDPAKTRVIPWGASALFSPCTDPDRLQAVRIKYKLPAAPYFLSLGTLEPRKNLDTLIRCFYRLLQQERAPDLYLVLAGPLGWDYGPIFQALRKHPQFAGRIVVTGYVADEDLSALYSAALAFVYPSLYEGFGLPPLEAMQCGTPVITSNLSSLPEVVGNAGILINPRDEDALAETMLGLYRSAGLRTEMSRRGLARAALFSWHECARQTVAVYREACGA